MITTECPNPAICDIPSGFSKSKVHKVSKVQYQTSVVRFFDKLQLTETKLTVNKAKEQVEMWYHKYHRYAQFNPQIFSVIDATNSFKSQYNGYMGIAPYVDNKKDRSFIWQLKD